MNDLDISSMLDEFHGALGDERGRGNATLRVKLHDEEHLELVEELTEVGPLGFRSPRPDGEVDRAKLARELADVVHLAFGTAHAFNIDLDAAIEEVHRAAMRKVDPPCPNWFCKDGMVEICGPRRAYCEICKGTGKGERKVREDGKVMKPEGFIAPDMSRAVR